MKTARRKPLSGVPARPNTIPAWKRAIAKRLEVEHGQGRGFTDPACYAVLSALLLDVKGSGEALQALPTLATMSGRSEDEAHEAVELWRKSGWLTCRFIPGGTRALAARLAWPLPPLPQVSGRKHTIATRPQTEPPSFLQ